MVVTRGAQKRVQGQGSYADYCRQQEKQLEADRVMIDTYRKSWQESKGVGHAVLTHIRDVLWWLEHVCGVNMVDYEEKVIVVLILMAVLVLILLGAVKQGAQLLQHVQQLATDTSR